MTTTKSQVKSLKNKIFAIGIHGVTGQQMDQGYLMPGTLIKDVREHAETVHGPLYRFEACTDGKCWFTQESYDKPNV